jgi:hypothetical protein
MSELTLPRRGSHRTAGSIKFKDSITSASLSCQPSLGDVVIRIPDKESITATHELRLDRLNTMKRT